MTSLKSSKSTSIGDQQKQQPIEVTNIDTSKPGSKTTVVLSSLSALQTCEAAYGTPPSQQHNNQSEERGMQQKLPGGISSLPLGLNKNNCQNNEMPTLNQNHTNQPIEENPIGISLPSRMTALISGVERVTIQQQQRAREQMIAQLRFKLGNMEQQKPMASRSIKRQKQVSVGGNRSIKQKKTAHTTDTMTTNATSVRGQYHELSMSKIENHIQQWSLRFIDLIICCMVVDNYIYGFMIFIASIVAIVIGWWYVTECICAPALPYMLILSGVVNIVEVHLRNLANQRLLDYFLVCFFRIIAIAMLILLSIEVLTIEPQLLLWQAPTDMLSIANYDGIYYCSTFVYYFTLYYVLCAMVVIGALAVYTLLCITYMLCNDTLSQSPMDTNSTSNKKKRKNHSKRSSQ